MKVSNYYKYITVLLILLYGSSLLAQDAPAPKLKPLSNYQLYQDEYSELDDVPIPTITTDENILSTLERARQKYLQALIMIDNGDTTMAIKYFEKALDIINVLVSYPEIDDNNDFTDLAHSIIDDFESFVPNLSNLDADTPIFIIKDKLLQEFESQTAVTGPEIISIETSGVSHQAEQMIVKPDTFIIPLPDNKYVRKSIDVFKKWNVSRKFIQTWLERTTKWFPMMKRIIEQEGMPEELVYLSMIESGLNPNAVSRAKAVGLWQFMRKTGEAYDLNAGSNSWIDERRDPEKSTRAAMRHLRDLYYKFGDWHLAMAAYNCGSGCVSRRIRLSKKKNPTFWDIRKSLPKETRWYVPKFIAAVRIATEPEKYGFNIDSLVFHDDYVYDTYTLKEPVNLKALARCANVSVDTLRELNPELIRMSTPAGVDEYELKIPLGARQEFIANFSTLTDDEKRPWVIHKVKRRETLSRIAGRYGTSAKNIAEMNRLRSSRSRLRTGQQLKIPIDADEYARINDQLKGSGSYRNGGSTDVVHRVKRGESLSSIARRYGVRIADLRNLNNISYGNDKIRIGQRLIVAKKETKKKEPKIARLERPKIVKHRVKRGETLAKIADMYDVTINSIKSLNRIKKTKILSGQTLKIQTSIDRKPSIASAPKPKSGPVVHKVRRGENLGSIAARYGVTEKQLKSWNGRKIKGTTVYSGSRLKIYPSQSSKGSSVAPSKKVNRTPKYYRVRKGDTLGKIARKFGLSVRALKKKNKNLNERRLQIGQKIRL